MVMHEGCMCVEAMGSRVRALDLLAGCHMAGKRLQMRIPPSSWQAQTHITQQPSLSFPTQRHAAFLLAETLEHCQLDV